MGREASPPADHNNVSRFPDKQTHRLHQDRFHAARCRVTVTGAGLAWVSDRAQVLSPGTLRLLVAHLPSSLAAVVQDRLVASSPVTRLSLPRSERARITRCRWRRCRLGSGNADADQDNGDHARRPWPADRRAGGAPGPRCRLPATSSAERVAAFARQEATGFHP